jgi:hypothetical protein
VLGCTYIACFVFSSVGQQSKAGIGCLNLEVYRSHTIRSTHTHTHRAGSTPLNEWSAVAETATHKAPNEHKRLTSMPSAGFEPAIPEFEPSQTYALDRTATRITFLTFPDINYFFLWMLWSLWSLNKKLYTVDWSFESNCTVFYSVRLYIHTSNIFCVINA